jgi:hypothetical protein
MSRIEELPDDFDETVNLNDAPEAPSIEELYNQHLAATSPAQNSMSSKSFEEVVQDISKTPLFMTSLDDAAGDGMRKSTAAENMWLRNDT